MAKKQLKGKVVSNKMDKALTVSVVTIKVHPLYNKRYTTRKKYHVACSNSSKYNIGDTVIIEACRPRSKTINFKVVEK